MIAPVFTLCIQGVEKRSTLSLPHITQQLRTSRSAKPSPLLAGNGPLESRAGPRAEWRSTEIEVRSPPTAPLPLQKGERGRWSQQVGETPRLILAQEAFCMGRPP